MAIYVLDSSALVKGAAILILTPSSSPLERGRTIHPLSKG